MSSTDPATAKLASALGAALLLLGACSSPVSTSPDRAADGGTQPSASASPTQRATVKSVHDGDTFTLTTGQKVRVLGINAPEIPPAGNQCYGQEAKDAANRILDGQPIELTADRQQGDTDRYGRLLRYVEGDGGDFAEQMLKAGYARVYERYPVARTPLYLKDQQAAQDFGIGLWKVCGP